MAHSLLARRVLTILVVIAFLTTCFRSTDAATTGTISGTVTDASGMPLPGAAVMVEGTRLGASTDSDGQYVILLVPPGEY